MGFQILIPKQVLEEIEKIKNSKKKLKFREDAELASKILGKNDTKKVDIGDKYVDRGILKFAKKNPRAAIATLDREIKKKTKNKKVVIRQKKKLELL